MTEDDQIAIVTNILQCRRAKLSLLQAETQYGKSLFLIRQCHLAREKARKHCSHIDEELQHAACEIGQKYKSALHHWHDPSSDVSSLHERSNSSKC